jgi:hypothetical protein
MKYQDHQVLAALSSKDSITIPSIRSDAIKVAQADDEVIAEKIKEVREAYEVLRDPSSRRESNFGRILKRLILEGKHQRRKERYDRGKRLIIPEEMPKPKVSKSLKPMPEERPKVEEPKPVRTEPRPAKAYVPAPENVSALL